jgi:predicted HAD superfamily phosphohydrolase YqeG
MRGWTGRTCGSSRCRPDPGGQVSAGYQQFTDVSELPSLAAGLGARTIVFDIEPLVATWDGTQDSLDRGISLTLDLVLTMPGVRAVCFATNSARRPAALRSVPGIDVSYLASARKPMHKATYARLPTPGVVVGDQVMTDGLLAKRLGYAFLHYRPQQPAPPGPRVLDIAGRLARPLIFQR